MLVNRTLDSYVQRYMFRDCHAASTIFTVAMQIVYNALGKYLTTLRDVAIASDDYLAMASCAWTEVLSRNAIIVVVYYTHLQLRIIRQLRVMLMCGNEWITCNEDKQRAYVQDRVAAFGNMHRTLYADAKVAGATFYDTPTHLEFTFTPDPLNGGNLISSNDTIALLPLGLHFEQNTGALSAVPVRNFSTRLPSYQVRFFAVICDGVYV